jgi:hypothetical protein
MESPVPNNYLLVVMIPVVRGHSDHKLPYMKRGKLRGRINRRKQLEQAGKHTGGNKIASAVELVCFVGKQAFEEKKNKKGELDFNTH